MSADPIDVLSITLIALAVIGWSVTIILVRAALRLRWPALQDRAAVSLILTGLRTGLGIFALAHFLDHDVPAPIVSLFIIVIFLTLGVIDIIWLAAYLTGRFNA